MFRKLLTTQQSISRVFELLEYHVVYFILVLITTCYFNTSNINITPETTRDDSEPVQPSFSLTPRLVAI